MSCKGIQVAVRVFVRLFGEQLLAFVRVFGGTVRAFVRVFGGTVRAFVRVFGEQCVILYGCSGNSACFCTGIWLTACVLYGYSANDTCLY